MKKAYVYLVVTFVVGVFGFVLLESIMEAKRVKYEQTVEAKIWVEIGATKAEKTDLGDKFAKMTDTKRTWSEVKFATVLYGAFLAAVIHYNLKFIKFAVEQFKKENETAESATAEPNT